MKVKRESEVAQVCPTLSNPMDTRLLHPWDFLGKSTRVGCHFLLKSASLISQLIKNPPAMQETPVLFLGWEDLLEKG